MRIQRPGKIVCVGRNYLEHARELGNAVPERPLLFLKPPSALIGEGETIVRPRASAQVEHEGEIGVVVGAVLHRVGPDEARAGIAGITCVNDVTARDLQKSDGQWTRAKGFDTFCPAGPVVWTPPAGFDLGTLAVTCRVNGEARQFGRGVDMAFDIPYLVSYISQVMTLEPGDLIATGTPAGVGALAAGDVVEVEIREVGVLRNIVADEVY
jgi:2-keto-4-pentenoate hydratase/2-oxohepta-3-ene-1,7-dioic acid hydratase in catechol pathway